MQSKLILSIALILSTTAGCAVTNASPNVYRTSEVMQAGTAERVTILRVRNVAIVDGGGLGNPQSAVPQLVGAGLAALLAYGTVGGGNGRFAAAALASPIGAIGAQQVAQVTSRRQGVEIIARTDSGRQIVVTQDRDQHFFDGQRAYLIWSAAGYRITN
jgi:outer membrane lipoprotein SlyB